MKGVIFSELINWAETEFSPQLADEMIQRSGLSGDGAYTTGGYYPHEDALALLTALSGLTARPINELARSYGRFLSGRLAALHPQFMANQTDTHSFLRSVESHIHSEVRKLYPEVRTPSVDASEMEGGLHVSYASHRPFADIAHGLIEGFIAYFGEDLQVERLSTSADGTRAEFRIGH